MRKRALVHIVWLLVGVFVLGLILKLSLDPSDNEPKQIPAATTSVLTEEVKEITPETSTAEKKEPTIYSAEDTVKFGDYQINVKGAESTKGTEEGSKLIQIQLSVKNIGKEPINVDSSYFEMYDQNDRKFETDAMDSFGGDPIFLMDSINPGLSLTRKVIFAVPEDVTSVKLAVRDNMFDLFDSADYVYIDIGSVK